MNRILFAFVLLLAVVQACRKDSDITTTRQIGPIPTVNVESSLTGRVTTPSGHPIPNASIEVAGLQLTTNDQGLFFVNKKLMDKNGTYVTASKPGFFKGARFAFPSLGTNALLHIHLIPKGPPTIFNANTGAIILRNGAQVTIPGNAIVAENGQLYAGDVYAFTTYLDPTGDSTMAIMPGDLRAQDSLGYAKVLRTFGMIGVELESPSGEKLNMGIEQKATISMAVPASLQADAPASIPLWHFDEADGYWKEEGSAALLNGRYEGKVKHFSFWNCDVPADYVLLHGCVGDAQGNPLPNIQVQLTNQIYGSRIAYTDNQGFYGGAVPANEALVLKVSDYCGHVVQESNIGPFSSDVTLDKIKVTLSAPITITGRLVDCANNPLSYGFVMLSFNDSIFNLLAIQCGEDGYFSATLNTCQSNTPVTLTAFDPNNLLQSTPIDYVLAGSILDVGSVLVCSNLDEFITLNVNGFSRTLNVCNFADQGSGFGSIYGYALGDDSTQVTLGYKDFAPNSATIQYLSIVYKENMNINSFGCEYCVGCQCEETDSGPLLFTNFPNAAGEYAIGSATGNVRSSSNVLVPYSINFKIKRQ